MLKRLYVHNYKCLVNFEINFDKDISLFLGANGSGKSTVFEVLAKLRRVIIDEEKINNVFQISEKPRWLKLSDDDFVLFELDIEVNGLIYKYTLELAYITNFDDEPYIFEESLVSNNQSLLVSKNRETIYDKKSFEFDDTRSSLNRFITLTKAPEFFQSLQGMLIARINPYKMLSNISKANQGVKTDFSNYAEWFAYLNEKNRRGVSTFEQVMRNVLPGFDFFKIEQAGQAKVLQVDFENPAIKKEIISYYFNELSEGQKVLIALYALIYCTPDNSIICIDEPENFLALPEIQPWFDALYDQCTERGLQVILISHHPKIINFLANDSGYWFSRENNLTRLQKISAENESGLSIAELIERGWIDEP